ncbi:hypothetical protein RB536_04075 [Escherichia coli]|nr:hypothetical protein RB536_04075 [Escherichia coli]
MPLRLSAAVMTTAATSVKSVLSSATTRRWVDKSGDQLAAGGNVHGFHKRKCPYREVKISDKVETLPNDMSGSNWSPAPTARHQ